MLNKRRLLVIDDELDIGRFICEVAAGVGFDAITCHRPCAFEQIYSYDIDVIILDITMPERDGIELLRSKALIGSKTGIILISGYDNTVLDSAQKLATERGLKVIGSLIKPIRIFDLEDMLSRVVGSIDNNKAGVNEIFEPPQPHELNAAMSNGELITYYQPQLNMATNSLVGMEALVRWQNPTRGLIGPDIIVSLAGRSGLMDDLYNEVLSQSLAQIKRLEDSGVRTKVAINMAPCNFDDLNLPEIIEEIIGRYGLEPSQVVLEVTETTLMEELIGSLDILTRLRMKGIRLSIDDFGTGYSSMVQLRRIPFSEIKIDRSFVLNAMIDPEALAIVKITIMLAHELGVTVVAEGVETKETWDLLVSLGCDIAQGYYKAKPMAGYDLSQWLQLMTRDESLMAIDGEKSIHL
jgi:EAL domain-containing protein (putative c-di-GMP-specific phosphodiesterase class I)